eukprot:scaffold16890_cov110-Isochrysis_galbana.AAC.9
MRLLPNEHEMCVRTQLFHCSPRAEGGEVHRYVRLAARRVICNMGSGSGSGRIGVGSFWKFGFGRMGRSGTDEGHVQEMWQVG